eukprot:9194411-Pyramimonas_sp.AAC.1
MARVAGWPITSCHAPAGVPHLTPLAAGRPWSSGLHGPAPAPPPSPAGGASLGRPPPVVTIQPRAKSSQCCDHSVKVEE